MWLGFISAQPYISFPRILAALGALTWVVQRARIESLVLRCSDSAAILRIRLLQGLTQGNDKLCIPEENLSHERPEQSSTKISCLGFCAFLLYHHRG